MVPGSHAGVVRLTEGATRLVQSGVDFYKVQRLLGHKSPMMTQ